ncbi:hypothetical protein [Rhodococcus sp. (in: high G+C Gram-positive bacteria)]|uniref:hypothetical protein n=1 Tax=Rhodococcus sp. TaxID=1831 RepID=UPI00257ED4F7|nr:hypothetical protein [Rhodococcus sp. (in: high G+C Gram-positive bacteria)]
MSRRGSFVWFDFGGVLSPPLDELFDSYADRTGIPTPVLHEAMAAVGAEYGMPTLAPIELGVVDERTWVRKLHAVIAQDYPGIDVSRSQLDLVGSGSLGTTSTNRFESSPLSWSSAVFPSGS